MNKHSIQLQKVEQLAGAGKLSRLLHTPARYLYAMMLSKCIYPLTHKGVLKNAPLFFGGEMQVLLPAATDIYLAGGKTHSSEIRLAKFMINKLQPGDCFLDIGAHFGYFTLLAASLVGDNGKVYAVEPASETYALLQQNTAVWNNIKLFHKAVSDKTGMVSFYEFPVRYSEYNTLDVEKFLKEDWIKKYNPQKTEVQATTIDGFLDENKLNPAMIKIDVEGAEVQAIYGGAHTWQGQSPVLIMEYLDEGNESSYTRAAAAMYGYGYQSYMITDDGKLAETSDILSYMRQHDMTSENIVFKK
ncbi:MAG: FkbM family methyltransferase [Taibaiella sp.]|nr:FkbM family methyltransferase [Taibaiella sp.]